MENFTHDITFISKKAKESEGSVVWIDEEVTKTATFKELSRTDRDQHKLHFKIISIGENFSAGDGDTQANFNSDGIYDITVKAINTLLVINPDFTAEDKKEFLSDSGAILSFGLWLLKEKLLPFFLTLKMT